MKLNPLLKGLFSAAKITAGTLLVDHPIFGQKKKPWDMKATCIIRCPRGGNYTVGLVWKNEDNFAIGTCPCCRYGYSAPLDKLKTIGKAYEHSVGGGHVLHTLRVDEL